MDDKLRAAMRDFCFRVLMGPSNPQEIATLPDILRLLLQNDEAASGN